MAKAEEFKELDSALDATIHNNGQLYHYFGGTAYLGIPQNADFLKLYAEGVRRYGISNGTSRTNNVQLGIYNDAESYAAKKWGAQSALITSSGFLAAQIAVKNLCELGEVRYAPATHPALWVAEKPIAEGRVKDWSTAVSTEINTSTQTDWVLICNSMNNLRPERYDFSFVSQINANKKVILIIDDSHGIGINYEGSSVLAAVSTQPNLSVVVVASMAKALGVDAGIILGNQLLISKLKGTSEFAGASPPSAAGLYAFMNGGSIYQKAFKKLKKNMQILSVALDGNPDWEFIPDFPVFFSKNADLSSRLLAKNILVSSFPYPDQYGEVVNRIVLSSWHDTQAIKKLIKALT